MKSEFSLKQEDEFIKESTKKSNEKGEDNY